MNEQVKQGKVIEAGDSQQAVGFVTSTAGASVVVVGADGVFRELSPGDSVREGDVLQVVQGSHVVITFADGSVRELPREGSFEIGQNNYQQLAEAEGYEQQNPEFEQLLAALEEGRDISEELEDTEAGEEANSGDEIGQGIQINLSGQEAVPTAGIDPDLPSRPVVDPTADSEQQSSVSSSNDGPGDGETQVSNIVISGAGSVEEADGVYLTYSVNLSNAVAEDVEISLSTSGTATAGADYHSTLQYESSPGVWTDVVGQVTLPSDGSVVNVRVEVLDDAITEDTESVILGASTSDPQISASSDTGLGEITDDQGSNPVDEDITAEIIIGDGGSVEEADGVYLTYSVNLSNAVAEDVEISLSTSGTATAGADYHSTLQYESSPGVWTDVVGQVTLPSDGSVVNVRVEVLDDAITEDTESVILGASTSDPQISASSDTGLGEITDDQGSNPVDEDITAEIIIGDGGSVEEADGVYLTYSVNLSNAVAEDVEISLSTSGTATAGADYHSTLQYESSPGVWTDVVGQVTLPSDGSVVNVRVEVLDDAITEDTESVILGASTSDPQISASSDTGLGEITDDQGSNPVDEDITAEIIIGDGGSVEEADGVYLTYSVNLSNAVAEDVEISLSTSGTATAGADYHSTLQYESSPGVWTDVVGQVTLPSDGSVVNVRVEVLDDAITEDTESVILGASTSDPQISASSDTGLGEITDDQGSNPVDEDITAEIIIGDGGSVEEADGVYLTYSVNLSNAVAEDVEISLSTSGTATAGADYHSTLQYESSPGVWTDVVGQVTLPSDGSVVNVRVEVLDDAITEDTESVILGASTSDPQISASSDTGLGEITDDQGSNPVDEDITAEIIIGDGGSVEEADGVYLTYSVNLSNAVAEDVEISLSTSGTATAGADYHSTLQYESSPGVWTDVVGQVTLPSDGSVVNVRVEVLDDAITEDTESVILGASTSDPQISASSDTGLGEITDDQGSNPVDEDITAEIIIGDGGSVEEADGVYLTYSVNLSNAVAEDVEISLSTSGTATAGADYHSTLQYESSPGVWTDVVGQVTLPSDGSVVNVRVEVLDDAITEDTESVILGASTSDPQISASSDTGLGEITDDQGSNPVDEDITAEIIIGDGGSVEEADGVYLTYSVNLSNAVAEDVEISLSTSGTATAGADYHSTLQYESSPGVWTDVVGQVTLPSDGSVVNVRVEVLDDAITEDTESVILGASTSDPQISASSDTGLGEITDDQGSNPVDEDITR